MWVLLAALVGRRGRNREGRTPVEAMVVGRDNIGGNGRGRSRW